MCNRSNKDFRGDDSGVRDDIGTDIDWVVIFGMEGRSELQGLRN